MIPMSSMTLDRPAPATRARRTKAEPRESLAQMDSEDLRHQLRRCLTMSAEGLLKAGRIIVELRRRKEPIGLQPASLVETLGLIGQGRLIPDLFIAYAGMETLVRAAQKLPVPEQQKLLDGAKVPLATRRGDRIETEMKDPADLKAAEVAQVFGDGRIRPAREQAVPPERPEPPARPPGAKVHLFLTVAEQAVITEKARLANKSISELLHGLLEKAGAFKVRGRKSA
jgi:hypothetical protein